MNIKRNLFLITFLFITGGIFACELEFIIIDSVGNETNVSPDYTITLQNNESYILKIEYTQDHGRCDVEYDDTVILLEDEKWKVSKDDLSFKLLSPIDWDKVSSRSATTEIQFQTKEPGKTFMEVIRDCDRKEGYDETFSFEII